MINDNIADDNVEQAEVDPQLCSGLGQHHEIRNLDNIKPRMAELIYPGPGHMYETDTGQYWVDQGLNNSITSCIFLEKSCIY